MPTTNDEADKIIKICSQYMDPDDIFKLAVGLYEQVGEQSENSSVKETMRMLYVRAVEIARSQPLKIHEQPPDTCSPTLHDPAALWFAAYWAVAIGHMVIWALMFWSAVMVTLYQPLYVAFPIISFAIYLLVSQTICPVTRLENFVRSKLGWPEINHFTHWYVICPLFHGRTCDRKCAPIRVGPG